MSDRVSAQRVSWKQSRYGFAVFSFFSLLGAWFLLRLVLLFAFKPVTLPPVEVLLALLSGFHRDVFGALLESIPLLLWLISGNHEASQAQTDKALAAVEAGPFGERSFVGR